MAEYVTGLQLFDQRVAEKPYSTGSAGLDQLIGGIQRGLFYFFYGHKELMETLFRHMTVQALAENKHGKPIVVYMLIGNYRKERTNLGLEELAELMEDSGYHL